MGDWYIVKPGGIIKKATDVERGVWFEDLGAAERPFMEGGRRVAFTDLGGGVTVSTVFLGLDHQFGQGPPVLFETMVFGGPDDQEQLRYCTHAEALAGHTALVKEVKAGPLLMIEGVPEFSSEDGGSTLIATVRSESGQVCVRVQSWSETGTHQQFQQLAGKRVRVTVEILRDVDGE